MMEQTFSLGVSILFLSFIGSTFSLTRYKNGFNDSQSHLMLAKRFQELQKLISRTTNLHELKALIQNEIPKILSIETVSLEMYNEGDKKILFRELYEFFHKNPSERVFIRSQRYTLLYKEYLSTTKELGNIPASIALIFPIVSISGHHIGIFVLSPKKTKAQYSPGEIDILKEFVFFLENQLKYIRTYSLMHEFSMILDRKVDTKILEYNSLVTRQKEFISVISHEVRSPLTSAIFQTENVLEVIESSGILSQKIYKEIQDLKSQLVRTGSLMSKLFSVEHYDSQGMHLSKEDVLFCDFLEYEIELFSRIYPDITFISEIEVDIGYVRLDKIHFQQVITNILDNAVKYANTNEGIIALSAKKEDKKLILKIEDNGEGLRGVSVNNIFDKYVSGNKRDIGLGLGLYLCKKIVTMHSGTIRAMNSEKYGGACFRIELPIEITP